MSDRFSGELQKFIFEHIDSIGLLEALLTLRSDPTKSWTASTLAQELRNNPSSVAQYLRKLDAMKLIRLKAPESAQYVYDDSGSGFSEVVAELADGYRVQRHRIYELIYSPLKKARDFSNAFLLPGNKKEDRDG